MSGRFEPSRRADTDTPEPVPVPPTPVERPEPLTDEDYARGQARVEEARRILRDAKPKFAPRHRAMPPVPPSPPAAELELDIEATSNEGDQP